MLKIFDKVESLVANNIIGSPIYYDFSSGDVEIKVQPKKVILDSTKTIQKDSCYNLNDIFYIQNNQILKLTLDQYQINDDGSISIIDDNISQGTTFLTNIPKITLGVNGVNQELSFNNIKPTLDSNFYILSTDKLNTTITNFTTEITGYPGTALKYNVNKFIGEKFKSLDSVICGTSTVDFNVADNTILIDENWWNSISKPFSIYYDKNGVLGEYYRTTEIAINNFSLNEINLDFQNSCIQVINVPDAAEGKNGLLSINANYYGQINNARFVFKPLNNDRSLTYQYVISNVINYYGDNNVNLVFNNCIFEVYMDYEYLFYLNGSNLIFNNCTFKLIKNTVNAYKNRGTYQLNDCIIELI